GPGREERDLARRPHQPQPPRTRYGARGGAPRGRAGPAPADPDDEPDDRARADADGAPAQRGLRAARAPGGRGAGRRDLVDAADAGSRPRRLHPARLPPVPARRPPAPPPVKPADGRTELEGADPSGLPRGSSWLW